MAFSWFKRRTSSNNVTVAEKAGFFEKDNQKAEMEGELEVLRAKHQVRLVSVEEEGTALNRLPDGVYGFSGAPTQYDAPLFRKKDYLSFEIHKLPDGTEFLVGFVSQEDAIKVAAANEHVTLKAFPDPEGMAGTLVRISLDRVVRHNEFSKLRQGKGLNLELYPVD